LQREAQGAKQIVPPTLKRCISTTRSHFAAGAQLGAIRAVNIGSSYRHKVFETVDLPD
jgi:hypothetical protein